MLRLLTLIGFVILGLAVSPGAGERSVAHAQTPCWCCTCQGTGCNCHTCASGGTVCDNRGGSGCDVTGTCPESFAAVDLLGDGSLMAASLPLTSVDSLAPGSVQPHGIRIVERVSLRDGWLVARDCRGLILHRKVAAREAALMRQKLREIVLE